MRPALVVLVAPLLVAAPGCFGHFAVPPASDVFEAGQVKNGRLELEDELAIATVAGTPEEIGAALGELTRGPTRDLIGTWRFLDFFRGLLEWPVPEARELEGAIPEPHRRELAALAKAADVDPDALRRANAVVDYCSCTAFAGSGAVTGGGPLVVGRNLDFEPANVLGRATLLVIARPVGARAFVSVGWPGFASVASGMNEDGLCASILVNEAAAPPGAGTSIGFLAREILEECGTVEEARTFFHDHPPASGQFLFLADPRTAIVLSRDAPERALEEGWLTCTNSRVDPSALVQTDARSRAASDLLSRCSGALGVEACRRILAATAPRHDNTQAMVFEPSALVLHVARGTTFSPAATDHWDRVELAAALREGGRALVRASPPVEGAFAHYEELEYPGLWVERRLDRARVGQAAR